MTRLRPKITVSAHDIAALLAPRVVAGKTLMVGVTGSVAVGKTTLSEALKTALSGAFQVASVSTDGFLMPNEALAARGLTLRKGYPETYDTHRFVSAIEQARIGPTVFPGYSHITYDVDVDHARTIDRPDILLLEGLGFAPTAEGPSPGGCLDALVYIDAREEDLEAWYVRRFLGFWRAAETDPGSFYAQFRTMSEPEVDAFARMVWTRVNLPNLREHISRARSMADIVLFKARNHGLTLVREKISA